MASAFFAATAVLLGSAGAVADEPDFFALSLTELMQVPVVTAGRYQEDITTASAVMSLITAEQIKASGADTLHQLLQHVTGIYMTGSHFFPRNVASMRGNLLTHADNHMLILLNGRPLRESYSGGINFAIYNAFPISSLNRVEVIRGPGSVLYGSNAFVGVINLVTETSKKAAELNLTAGQQGLFGASINHQFHYDELNVHVSARLSQQDGWPFQSFDNNAQQQQIHYGQRNAGLFAGLSWQQWQLDLLSVSSSQDFFGAATNWRGGIPPAEREVQSQRHHAALSHHWQQNDHFWLDTSLTLARMDFSHYNYDAYANERLLEFNQHWQPNDTWHWLAGASIWWQRYGTHAGLAKMPVPLTDTRRDTAYLQADWFVIPTVKLSAGVQYNHNQRGQNAWLPRLAVNWQINPHWGSKLLYASAYRDAYGVETDFNIILTNSNGETIGGLRGNPSLDAEQITTTDLQVFYQTNAHRIALTGFYSKADSLISRQRAADRVIDFVNQGTMQLHGLELELQQQISNWLKLDLGASWQQNQVNNISGYTTVPQYLLKTATDITLPAQWGKLNVSVNYTSAATDIAVRNPSRRLVNPPADAYWLVNMHWRLPVAEYWQALPAGLSVNTYVYNVFDADIYQSEFVGQTINTIPASGGRQISVTLALPF